MKKILVTFVMMAMLAVMIPLSTNAQTNGRYYTNRSYYSSYYKKPNVYDRHRKLINIAGGSVAGALLGGLIGGKRGAGIGALLGAGGGAIVTAKQRSRNYYRAYR